MIEASRAPIDLAGASPFVAIGAHRVRLLRDGAAAFPAMLDAIARAEREILLEMYWLGDDAIGRRFREAMIERARQGVRVLVLFDSVGSLATPASFWEPLVDAGATVLEFAPISPLARGFRALHVFYRDHRKLLLVDGAIGFTGGINIGEPWCSTSGEADSFRDDAVEIRGPAVRALRAAFGDAWTKSGGGFDDPIPRGGDDVRVRVLTNPIGLRKRSRAIRRAYLYGVRRAARSIDIAAAYFLPDRIFLGALRRAARRGRRVRLLLPERSDVPIVALATSSIIGRLLAAGVEVWSYAPRILHAKTAVFDARYTMIGSYNLDAMSSRFNLECNVVLDSEELARFASASFERDLGDARRLDLAAWKERPIGERALGWFAALFKDVL